MLGADADPLEAAAWLHDIGYAPDLAVTGLHALDAARYLRDAQVGRTPFEHHRRSRRTGACRRLSLESSLTSDTFSSVLTLCDMTTSPDGEPIPIDKQHAEIHHRYGRDHLVSRSIPRDAVILRSGSGSQ